MLPRVWVPAWSRLLASLTSGAGMTKRGERIIGRQLGRQLADCPDAYQLETALVS